MIGYGNSMFLSTILDTEMGVAPFNTVAPIITGTAQEGQTVTCSTGTWTGTPTITYAYQWKRNGSSIIGANTSSYLLSVFDVGQSITCTVTATNSGGSSSATSNTITPISAFTGLLDIYTSASAAYSLRRLSTSYTGSLIRVRRSSDNTELNIGYDSNNVLDETALTTFVGAGSGFITTWYDQSGNANNAVQTTAANQPRIVNSGTIDKVNNKPCAVLDGTNDSFNLTSTINVSASNYQSFVGKRTVSGNRLYALSGSFGQQYLLALLTDNKYYLQSKSTHYRLSNSTDTTTAQLLLTGLNAAGTTSIYKNGSSIASTELKISITNQIGSIGNYLGGSGFLPTCGLQEIVFYNLDQSTNRTGIETNINTFYSIY